MQVAGGLRRGPTAFDDAASAPHLSLDGFEGDVDELVCDTGLGETRADEGVPGAALGEGGYSQARKALVVDEPVAMKDGEGPRTIVLREASTPEMVVDLVLGPIPMTKSAKRSFVRVVGHRLDCHIRVCSRRRQPSTGTASSISTSTASSECGCDGSRRAEMI